MKIEYEKPWYLKPNIGQTRTNLILRDEYTISLSFRVGKYFARDEKIGFFGVPGKNFGVSYDYEVDLFVFEFWTIPSFGYKFFGFSINFFGYFVNCFFTFVSQNSFCFID